MQLQQLLPRPTDLVYVYTRGIHLLKIMEMIQSPILLFAYKQWGNITIKGGLNFGYFTYPLIYPTQAQSVALTHMNNNHTVLHSAVYLDSRSRCALYGETTFTADTEFYIIAIGY